MHCFCTEPEVESGSIERVRNILLPIQTDIYHRGAPTAHITNIICYRMDRRFEGLARRFNYTYARYADDMTFSAKKGAAADDAGKLIWGVKKTW